MRKLQPAFVVLILFTLSLLACSCATRTEHSALTDWLKNHRISDEKGQPGVSRIATVLSSARVIGLGEATHGQHEAFELKRIITMTLIRYHGYRVVAYEASASNARACDDYVQGRIDDRLKGMRGFGMLIWDVEENAALLDDLREWNASAAPADRVRFIGFDAQDGEAVVGRIVELIGEGALADRVKSLPTRSGAALQRLFEGDRSSLESLNTELDAIERDLLETRLTKQHDQAELKLRCMELRAFATMYSTPGGRDKAMAELLTSQLNASDRCVVWAHNGHVKRTTLDLMGTDELAMGGHLAKTFGADYYALGFTFGYGGFQANAPDASGRWGFKRYYHNAPATGSLEADIAATGLGDVAVDLRSAPTNSAVQSWLHSSHGHRWWGGYKIPDDYDERTRDASQLMQMVPANDFDGLIYLERTTAATPMNKSLIITPSKQ